MPFGLSESYSPSLSGYTPPYTLPLTGGVSGSAGDTPLWAQIVGGLGQIGSLIDPYILTEQERLQYQLQLAQAQAEAAKAQAASVQAQPVVPVWVWVLVGLGVVLLLVFALKE